MIEHEEQNTFNRDRSRTATLSKKTNKIIRDLDNRDHISLSDQLDAKDELSDLRASVELMNDKYEGTDQQGVLIKEYLNKTQPTQKVMTLSERVLLVEVALRDLNESDKNPTEDSLGTRSFRVATIVSLVEGLSRVFDPEVYDKIMSILDKDPVVITDSLLDEVSEYHPLQLSTNLRSIEFMSYASRLLINPSEVLSGWDNE